MTAEQLFLALLRADLKGEPFQVPLDFATFKAVFNVARRHDLAYMVCHAVAKSGILPTPETEKQQAILERVADFLEMTQYRYVKLEAELEHVGEALEREGIPYMPLKGAVMRVVYPEPWMRVSCDIDILVHAEDFDRAAAVLVAEGFETNGVRGYHDQLFSCDDVKVELHHNILERCPRMDAVLETVWEHTVSKGCKTVQTPDFFAFHIVAHAAYHFMHGGCGVRPVLDLWLLRQSGNVDEAAVRELCDRAALLDFYESVCRLGDVWFSDAEHDDLTCRMEAFLLNGSLFGSSEQRGAAEAAQYGRFGFVWRTVFMPYRDLKQLYPALDGKPILTPYYQMCRLVQKVSHNRGKKAFKRAVTVAHQSDRAVETVDGLLSDLGLYEVTQ